MPERLADPTLRSTIITAAALFALAAFGGLLRVLHRRMKWVEAVVGTLTSAFTGMVVGVGMIHYLGKDHWPLIIAVVAVVAWIGGTVVLDVLADTLTNALKKNRSSGHGLVADVLGVAATLADVTEPSPVPAPVKPLLPTPAPIQTTRRRRRRHEASDDIGSLLNPTPYPRTP